VVIPKAAFPVLYPILDTGILPPPGAARQAALRVLVQELAEAGVTILQYRNKQGSQDEILEDARIMRSAAGARIKLILNDWPTLAVEAEFDGVHVGQQDMSPGEARKIVGSGRIVGVSTHNEIQVRDAEKEPVDYIAVGPIYATASKQNPDPVVGLEGIRMARTLTSKSLVAIGGITMTTALEVRSAGADSIAVISAIFAGGGRPAKLAKDFLDIFR
jgi:thiamine-phosphate pyrophosphorylase